MVKPAVLALDQMDGLILAGGRSMRMRTQSTPEVDKGLQPLRGAPLVAWVVQYMQAQGVANPCISANHHLQDYAVYGRVIQDDPAWSGCGPLAGLLAGLQQLQGPWLFVLPVDVLRWPPDLLARLQAAARPASPAYARTPDGPHPLCLVLHSSLASRLQAFLHTGGRQVQSWLQACSARAVDFPQHDTLVNLNTPQDWARWQGI